MAKVLPPAEFQKCPRGTVFGYGGRWHFSPLLILDEVIVGQGFWGFYACNPIWVDGDESSDDANRLEEMLNGGASYPAARASSKFMSYDGDAMECFFVLEGDDLRAMFEMTALGGGSVPKEIPKSAASD